MEVRTITYLEVDQVKRLEEEATNLRDKLLVRLLFHLGCRVSEVLNISVKDINFAQGTVMIQHLKTRLALSCPYCSARLSRSHSFCPKCGEKVIEAIAKELKYQRMRILPFDKETIDMLRDFIKRGGSVKRKDDMFIFGLTRHRAWQIVKECAEKAGLPKLVNPETGRVHNVSPHKLRDAFAVHAVKQNDSGDGLRLLQEHLGHQNFNTTAKYRKVSGEEHREWYDRLWKEDKP
ncbi:tyrosine-type recombinase/integrase [Chloroflexota bacterium]